MHCQQHPQCTCRRRASIRPTMGNCAPEGWVAQSREETGVLPISSHSRLTRTEPPTSCITISQTSITAQPCTNLHRLLDQRPSGRRSKDRLTPQQGSLILQEMHRSHTIHSLVPGPTRPRWTFSPSNCPSPTFHT